MDSTTPNGTSQPTSTSTPTPTTTTITASSTDNNNTATTTTTTEAIPPHLDPSTYPRTKHIPESNIHIELTYTPLDTSRILSQISSPHAGANILFLGTTRDSFEGRAVSQLSYQSYAPLALHTLSRIAEKAVTKHSLLGISISHRLGIVPIGEASIAIAVSSAHRRAAWRAGEEVLEECKERAEIWKREEFVGESPEEGKWRENRERDGDGKLVMIPSAFGK